MIVVAGIAATLAYGWLALTADAIGWQFSAIPWLYVMAGLIALQRRAGVRIGLLLGLTGLAYTMLPLQSSRIPAVWTTAMALDLAIIPALALLLLAFPDGRLKRRWERAFVLATVIALVCWTVIPMAWLQPNAYGCTDCPSGLNLLEIDDPLLGLRHIYEILPNRVYFLAPMLLLLAAVCVLRWVRASRARKRITGVVLLAAIPLLLAMTTQIIYFSFKLYDQYPGFVDPLYQIAMYAGLAHPVAYLLSLWWLWSRKAKVSGLVLELAGQPSPELLERAVGKALGDPTLVVGRWDGERYVTADGCTLEPASEGTRRTTYLESEGKPLAVVVHDSALLDDGALLNSVGAVTRLAVDNERLQAELTAQLEEVRASRSRIVAATDGERRRLERDLHDGAQQRLVTLTLDARLAAASSSDPAVRQSVAAIADGLTVALAELRELARGIHPSMLGENGLGSCLQTLAERSAVPVRLVGVSERRYPAAVETAAYFVVSEALANAAKHAMASEVVVSLAETGGRLVVEVADDGVGGADPAAGSGLGGLADRVASVDGVLRVESAPGCGTRVVAEFPCVS
ncbi:histidine kinase [Kribbella sp. NPDC051718]|uniref:sensor histidine kinase n=1 Tax=Kribbella sp. NPDC051718 TaxID=3155168 RepID=UPI0034183257